jgi:hypothetical protein
MSTVTTTDKLTIVKLLAAGRDAEFVATAVSTDVYTVVRTASGYGYPDQSKLAWAADVLQKQIDEAARPAVAPAAPVRPPAQRPTAPTPRPLTAVPGPAPDEVRAVIARGLKSERPRIRRFAEKARDAVDALTGALRADEEQRRQDAARAAEQAKARSEVERLERELAAAKALLRGDRSAAGGATTPPATDVHGVQSKVVRAWAAENGVTCPKAGRVPRAVVEQYVTATRGEAA